MFFNEKLAAAYGVNGAVLLQNFAFWINLNKQKAVNFKEGRYWTYISLSSLTSKFDFLSVDKIRYCLAKLISAGVLIKNNFNKTKYDRTCWYSFADDALLEDILSKLDFSQMDKGVLPNRSKAFPQPIPDIKKDIKTDVEVVPDKNTALKEVLPASSSVAATTNLENSSFKKLSSALLSRHLSKSQVNLLLSSFPVSHITAKIELYDYLLKNNPQKMKNKARFLFMSIKDDWTDDKYEAYLADKKQEKARVDRDLADKIKKDNEKSYDKYILAECKKEYSLLSAKDLHAIDQELKKSLTSSLFTGDLYTFALESKRVAFIYERIKPKLLSFADFAALT
jgi:hypothetical protein